MYKIIVDFHQHSQSGDVSSWSYDPAIGTELKLRVHIGTRHLGSMMNECDCYVQCTCMLLSCNSVVSLHSELTKYTYKCTYWFSACTKHTKHFQWHYKYTCLFWQYFLLTSLSPPPTYPPHRLQVLISFFISFSCRSLGAVHSKSNCGNRWSSCWWHWWKLNNDGCSYPLFGVVCTRLTLLSLLASILCI